MKTILNILFFISLIINSLNADACSEKAQGNCSGDCVWKAEVAATCTIIEGVLTTECNAAVASDTACKAVVSGTEEVCSWTAATDSDPKKCEPKTAVITTLCTPKTASESECTGVKSGNVVLCEYTPKVPGKCNAVPVTFSTSTIKLKSVKGKNVVITIEPASGDTSKKVTDDTTIKNLQLNSGESFTKDLTCKIVSGSTLGDVECTMDTAATKDTKYKLIAKSGATVTYEGNDTFGTITVDPTEVTATEDSSNNPESGSSSSFLKITSFFTFLFLLF
jgi:hypothetical protein